MLGTIIDTLIICTMTGLTIVITDSWNVGLDGVDVTTRAFQQGLPFNSSIASFILMVCLVFFAFTTILGWDYYSASLAMGHKVQSAPGWCPAERLLCLELSDRTVPVTPKPASNRDLLCNRPHLCFNRWEMTPASTTLPKPRICELLQ